MSKNGKTNKSIVREAADDSSICYDNQAADGLYEVHVDSTWDQAVLERSGELYHRVCVAMSARTEDGVEVGLFRAYEVRRAADVRDLRCLAAQVDLPLNDERDIPELIKRLWYERFKVLLSTDDGGRRIVHFIDKAPGDRDVPDARDGDNIWDHAWHHELRREEGFNRHLREHGYGYLLPQSAR